MLLVYRLYVFNAHKIPLKHCFIVLNFVLAHPKYRGSTSFRALLRSQARSRVYLKDYFPILDIFPEELHHFINYNVPFRGRRLARRFKV